MNQETSEAVLALALELERAADLASLMAQGRDDFDAEDSLVLRLAAERIIERVFQATEALPEEIRLRYFGTDGLRYLRGMRNRLAHNYLGIDSRILRETIEQDLPAVVENMADDVAQSRTVLAELMDATSDQERWAQKHLGQVAP